jgi:hypothetical protein
MKNQSDLVKTLMSLHILLTPFVLGGVAYSVINSNFDGLIKMNIGRTGGEVLIDRRTPPGLADK